MMALPQLGKKISEGSIWGYVDHYPLHLKMTLLMASFPLCMSMAEKTNQ